MAFETDKQTLNDLNILGKYKSGSIFSMYNGTITRMGERILEKMFATPLTDAISINKRSEIFKYFSDNNLVFPYRSDEFDEVDQYIHSCGKKQLINIIQLLKTKAMSLVKGDEEFKILKERIIKAILFLNKTKAFLNDIKFNINDNKFKDDLEKGIAIFNDHKIKKILSYPQIDNPNFIDLMAFDNILRGTSNVLIKNLFQLLCEIDVYIEVGNKAREKRFCFAHASDDGDKIFEAKGLYHPNIDGATSNELDISSKKNVFFLTGANMAGKSTLMKSFGIAVYLAHMGFPIAAKEMQFVVRDGIYTSINVPDNINLGYSHFYAEVLRVKNVALEVSKSKRLVVILDELFKGTNVKDAYDATLSVSQALSRKHKCAFMISTHIIEVGLELKKKCDNVEFEFLPTVMDSGKPTYTYKLTPGITEDKHGMIIINNEKIIEIIKGEVEHTTI